MRILFVNRMVTLVRGGGETFDLEVGRSLSKTGCRISFLSARPLLKKFLIRIDETGFDGGCCSYVLAGPYLKWFPWDKVKGGWRIRLLEYRVFERRAVHWIMKHQDGYDVIQICELPYVVAELKRRGCTIPVVLRLTAPNYGDKLGGVQQADAVIASGMTIQKMKDEGHDTVYDIPNSVDIRLFRPKMTEFREENDIGELEFVLLYVARFQDFKDHETLIRALKITSRYKKGIRLVLAGSGHMERTIKSLVQKFGLEKRVLFLGEVPYEQLPGVYAAADIKVISSVYESFCFAAIEAMACELPIITTNNGWVPRLIGDEGLADKELARDVVEEAKMNDDGGQKYRELIIKFRRKFGHRSNLSNILEGCDPRVESEERIGERLASGRFDGGIVVPVGDAYALAEAVLWISKKKSLMERMGKRNREYVKEHYVWERNAQKLLDVYEGILG